MNKKTLYESIMKDVSKIVKKHLNEEYIDDADNISVADIVQKGIDDGTLEFIGTAYDKDVIDLNAAFDYVVEYYNNDEIDEDDLYDELVDTQTADWCIYDPDVLWQLSTGSDGLADEVDPADFVVY